MITRTYTPIPATVISTALPQEPADSLLAWNFKAEHHLLLTEESRLFAIKLTEGAMEAQLPIVLSITQPPLAIQVTPTTAAPASASGSIGSRLIIPVIGVNAPVTAVGLDRFGNMAAPAGWFDIAWYQYGSRPGQPGNAVMAGHLDTNTGAPATFWDLGRLVQGDHIIYSAPDGGQLLFLVEETALYPWDQIPLERVFSRVGDPHIVLITCGGLWSRQNLNYSHRAIVFGQIAP